MSFFHYPQPAPFPSRAYPHPYAYSAYDPYAQQAAYRRALAEERAYEQQRRRARQLEEEERAYRLALARRQQHEEALRQQALRQAAYERELARRRRQHQYFPSFRHVTSEDEASNHSHSDDELSTPRSPSPKHVAIVDTASTPAEPQDLDASPSPPTSKMDRDLAAVTLQRHYRSYLKRRQALAALKDLANALEQHRSSYTPPALLEFQSSSSSEPKLSFSNTNAPHLAYEDFLVELLTKADGISTNGDGIVKKARKALVVSIEKELAALDDKKMSDWAKRSSSLETTAVGQSEGNDDAEFYDCLPESQNDVASSSRLPESSVDDASSSPSIPYPEEPENTEESSTLEEEEVSDTPHLPESASGEGEGEDDDVPEKAEPESVVDGVLP